MSNLLDFNSEFNAEEFDQIVLDALNPASSTQKQSEAAIMALKESNNGWMRTDTILKNCKNEKSKFFGLQILEHAIKTRWALFDPAQKASLKQYLVDNILGIANNETILLNKFNIVLVEVLKKEWPLHWPDFITSLVNASQTISLSVCRNSLFILKRLNEEVFDYSQTTTTVKRELMQNQLKSEFSIIFNLIKTILENNLAATLEARLIENTFETFISFSKCMSQDYIFKTTIVNLFIEHLNSPFTIHAIKCLKEVVVIGKDDCVEKKEKLTLIHSKVVEFLSLYASKFKNAKLKNVFNSLAENEKLFVMESVFLLSALYENHFSLLEKHDSKTVVRGFELMAVFFEVREDRIFKRGLDFWSCMIYAFYTEFPFCANGIPERLRAYENVLKNVGQILVDRMPRPREVFVITNELDDLVVDKQVSASKIEHYNKMRETLFHLCHLIGDFLRNHFKSELRHFASGEKTGREQLNKTCWAVGCISQSFKGEVERDFFMEVIKELLTLCEIKESKDEKAIVASNIIYVIGQYHSFLLQNREFLRILVKKLFEFMCETHEGIRDMAVDTFLTVSQKCGPEFFRIKENGIFMIYEIVRNVRHLTSLLSLHQQRVVYEAICNILTSTSTVFKENADESIWNQIDILASSFTTVDFFSLQFSFSDTAMIKILSHFIRSYGLIFKIIPSATKPCYETVLTRFIGIYVYCVKHDNIQTNGKVIESQFSGKNVAGSSVVSKNSNLIKNDLIEMFTEVIKAGDVNDEFLNSLFQNVIYDYRQNINSLILGLAKEIVLNCQFSVDSESFLIHTLLVPSFVVVQDPDINTVVVLEYFKFVDALVEKRFVSFFPNIYQSESFSAFINTLLSGLSGLKEISDCCLGVLAKIVKNCYELKNYVFFKNYIFVITENIFALILDKDKRYNFDAQCSLVCYIININSYLPQFTTVSNKEYFYTSLKNLFSSFKNIREESFNLFLEGLFELCFSQEVFIEHLRDFSMKIYEFDDVDYLELERVLLQRRIAKCRMQ